ncbi:PhnD/SsuA/transferrin family substrate-binding protein [Sphingomonas sp. TREG-RG-20F-R18-01]|uniref:phosphate/phosphite/phosphonate ABC transporter substrate-binding protein n=1 Tax=Sphingomonas sp. TREG-RG-20F-R18-01 TaxID=2914982 RepID=UPI001F571BB3
MSTPVASLGMYDHPAQHAANDRLWSALAHRLVARGIAAPRQLDRARSVEAIWRDPRLLLAQACGYPLVTDPRLALRVVGIPVYDVPDCGIGTHLSYLIGRREDAPAGLAAYRARRAAINARTSNSGHNLFRAAIAPLARDGRFFAGVVETGSHRASVAAVRDRIADIAAIDAVSYAALCRFEPAAVDGLRIVARTAASPALPFVTARSTPIETVAALRIALADMIGDPALARARDALFLKDVLPAGVERFAAVRTLEDDAIAAGYPVLQ